MKILLVEDEADVRDVILEQLKSADYEVTEAKDADEALTFHVQRFRPRAWIVVSVVWAF